MVKELLLFTQLQCAPTQVVNNIEMTDQLESIDIKHLSTAQTRCGQIYKSSPCVKRFEIYTDPWGQRGYRITCYTKHLVKPGIMR